MFLNAFFHHICKKIYMYIAASYHIKTRKNAIVEYLDYQIPVTQLNRDMQATKRD